MKNKYKTLIGLTAAFAVFFGIFLFVDYEEVLTVMAEVHPTVIILLLASMSLALLLRGYVYIRLLRGIGFQQSYYQGMRLYLIYTVFRYSFPYAMAGTQGIFAYLTTYDGRTQIEDSLAPVVIADLIVYIPHFTLGIVGVLVYTGEVPEKTLYSAVGLFIAVSLFTWILFSHRGLIHRIVEVISGITDTVLGIFVSGSISGSHLTKFYDSVDKVSSKKHSLFVSIVAGHLGMIFIVLPLPIAGYATGVKISFAFAAGIVMMTKLSGVLPTPGGLGGIEAIMIGILISFGDIEAATAVTITLLYRVSTYWYTLLVGGIASVSFLR